MTFRLRVLVAVMLVSGAAAVAEPPPAPAPAPSKAGSVAAAAPAPDRAAAKAPEGTIPAKPSAVGADAASPPPGELGPDGTYTIKTGDTLWDLSQRFLDNPWYWPKIWADNPTVENPHWIYPGHELRIRSTGAGLPAEVQPPPEADKDEGDDEPIGPGKADVADFSSGTVGRVDNLGQDADLVTQSGRLVFQPKPMMVEIESLVTDRELAASGVISGSFEQKELLSTYDRVYIRFAHPDDAKIGQTFSIFRTGTRVFHPVTKQPFGYETRLVGTLRIVGREGAVALGEIGQVNGSVTRGDHLGPAVSLERSIQPVPNAKELSGVILATQLEQQQWIADDHVVFVDKGAKDGVQRGNTFDVVQSGDGLDELRLQGATQEKNLPAEVVAELMVFDVRENSSAAMVVKCLREVAVGDRVEMHPAPLLLPGAGGDAP